MGGLTSALNNNQPTCEWEVEKDHVQAEGCDPDRVTIAGRRWNLVIIIIILNIKPLNELGKNSRRMYLGQ